MFYRTRDPNQEKTRLRCEIRRMPEAYKRGLYEGDEHTFWREIEGHQMQLDALEQFTPFEVRQAGKVLANLQTAWRRATPDEQREICNIILDKIVYDFELGKIAKIIPKPEYKVLFKMVDNPALREDT